MRKKKAPVHPAKVFELHQRISMALLWTVPEILPCVNSMEVKPHRTRGTSHILQGIEVICLYFCSSQVDDQFWKGKDQFL